MTERRIVARVQDADVIAGLKAGAAAYRARFTQFSSNIHARGDSADLVVLEAAADIAATIADMDAAKSAYPNAGVIIIARADTRPEDVRKLFRSGALDVLSPPVTQDQLLAAMSDAIGATAANGGSGGKVIAVVKAAGGVGATTIAANLAGFLASPVGKRAETAAPRQVAVLDLDVQFGNLALALDIRPRSSVTEILKSPKRLDSHFLDGVLEKHRSGLRLLPAPPAVIPLDAIDPAVAMAIVETAAQSFDTVIVDLPDAWTDWTSTIVRRADLRLLVANASVRGVAGARRVLDAASSLEIDADRWGIVFNRVQSMLDSKDIIDRARMALKTTVVATIAEDAAAREANDRGRLIWDMSPNSRFAKDMRPMVAEIDRLLERTAQPEQSRRLR